MSGNGVAGCRILYCAYYGTQVCKMIWLVGFSPSLERSIQRRFDSFHSVSWFFSVCVWFFPAPCSFFYFLRSVWEIWRTAVWRWWSAWYTFSSLFLCIDNLVLRDVLICTSPPGMRHTALVSCSLKCDQYPLSPLVLRILRFLSAMSVQFEFFSLLFGDSVNLSTGRRCAFYVLGTL